MFWKRKSKKQHAFSLPAGSTTRDLRGCPSDKSETFKDGFAAFHSGWGIQNPHGKLTIDAGEWQRGYSYAQNQGVY